MGKQTCRQPSMGRSAMAARPFGICALGPSLPGMPITGLVLAAFAGSSGTPALRIQRDSDGQP